MLMMMMLEQIESSACSRMNERGQRIQPDDPVYMLTALVKSRASSPEVEVRWELSAFLCGAKSSALLAVHGFHGARQPRERHAESQFACMTRRTIVPVFPEWYRPTTQRNAWTRVSHLNGKRKGTTGCQCLSTDYSMANSQVVSKGETCYYICIVGAWRLEGSIGLSLVFSHVAMARVYLTTWRTFGVLLGGNRCNFIYKTSATC